MNAANWTIVIFTIIIVLLIAIALWFPRGRKDWPLSPRGTVYLIVAGLFFILLVILINIVSQHVNWSGFVTTSIYFSIAIFIVLVLVGLFFPDGFRQQLR